MCVDKPASTEATLTILLLTAHYSFFGYWHVTFSEYRRNVHRIYLKDFAQPSGCNNPSSSMVRPLKFQVLTLAYKVAIFSVRKLSAPIESAH